jgi:diguanylate cyclase (GGDEF)-like protein
VACSTAALFVVAACGVLVARDPTPFPWPELAGVLTASALVTAFPLVLGTGRKRASHILDGTVFVIGALLLQPALAVLALSLPSGLYELVRGRRELDRRIYFATGLVLSNALALAVFGAVAPRVDATVLDVALAITAAFLGIGSYHAGLIVLLRWRGTPVPAWMRRRHVLFPSAHIYLASALAGGAIALIGTQGPGPFWLALLVGAAFHVLYWQYRRLVLARTRTDQLFRLAADLPGLTDAAAVEERVRSVAAELLRAEDVRLEDAPPAEGDGLTLQVRGRTRWLVPTTAISNLDVVGEEDHRAVETLTRVAGSALERLALEQELRAESRRDPLTGVLNRTAFDTELRTAIARGRRDGHGFTLAYGDLDDFKPVNDEYGHHLGDEVLREIARRLVAGTRAGDVVARIGGDEFVLLWHDTVETTDIAAAASLTQDRVGAPMEVEGVPVKVGISIGWARWPQDADTPQALIRAADARMYEAKRVRR